MSTWLFSAVTPAVLVGGAGLQQSPAPLWPGKKGISAFPLSKKPLPDTIQLNSASSAEGTSLER